MGMNIMSKDDKYSKYTIGRFTYGTPDVADYWKHPGITLTIGAFCSLAKGVKIYLGGNHHIEWISTFPLNNFMGYDMSRHSKEKMSQIGTKGSVAIGNDVWIGCDAIILSGVTIGDGAVVGANSVVSKDLPPYTVSVGNPSRIVKKRFDDDVIDKLLKIKWWNWEDEKIKENIPLILSENIDAFLNKHSI